MHIKSRAIFLFLSFLIIILDESYVKVGSIEEQIILGASSKFTTIAKNKSVLDQWLLLCLTKFVQFHTQVHT